jgi:hypothetical protein
MMDEIKAKVYPKERAIGLKSYKIIDKYDLYGFTNYSKFNFLQLIFYDSDSMRSFENVFRKKIKFYNPKLGAINLLINYAPPTR